MAAPLPSGIQTQVISQAPRVDPAGWVQPASQALAIQQAGLLLGQEIANLENKKGQRALEAEKIKLDMQKSRLEKMQADETLKQLQDPGTLAAIVGAGLQDRARQEYERENLKAQAAAYGAAGLSFRPAGTMAPGALAGQPAAVPPSTAGSSGALSNATVPPPATSGSPLAKSPLFQLGLDKKAAEKEVEIREQAKANEQTDLNKEVEKLNNIATVYRPGLYVEGTELIDPAKLTALKDTLKKDPRYAAHFRERAGTSKAFDSRQEMFRTGLQPYVSAGVISDSSLIDPDGSYNPEKSEAALKELARKYPVQSKAATPEQIVALGRMRTAVDAIDQASKSLDRLGDPGFFETILNSMPDPEAAKGSWRSFRDSAAARGLNDETVARNVLVDVLNSQVQTAFTGMGQAAGSGLSARKMTLFDKANTNAQLKMALKEALPVAREHYEGLLSSTANPEIVADYLGQRKKTPSQVKAQREAPPAPAVPEFLSRLPVDKQTWVSSGKEFYDSSTVRPNGEKHYYRKEEGGLRDLGWRK
jgi:hypothetical protein